VFLELLHQGENLGRCFRIWRRSGIFRFVDEATRGRDHVFGPEGLVHGIKAIRGADDFGGFVSGWADVIGPGIEGGFQDGIRVGVFQKEDAFSPEHPGHGVGAGKIAFVFGEKVTDFGGGSVFIVGLGLDHEGGASGGISLVSDLLQGAASLEFAGAFLDGAVDFVDWHGFGPGGGDGRAEPGVEVGVTSGKVGGHGDLFGQLGEESPAFNVGGPFGALDFGPVTMTCHTGQRLRWKRRMKSAEKRVGEGVGRAAKI